MHMVQDPLGEGADGPDERGWERPKQDFLYSGKSLRHRIKTFGWVRVIPMQPAKPGPKWKRADPYLTVRTGGLAPQTHIVARLFKVLDAGDALSATPPP